MGGMAVQIVRTAVPPLLIRLFFKLKSLKTSVMLNAVKHLYRFVERFE
jgi:hypothetical protein